MSTGACTVCGALVKIVTSTGVLYRHGHGHGRFPCAGSGLPPQAPAPPILDASGDLFEDDPTPNGGVAANDFVLLAPHRATLRRIPRGARQKAAQAFETRIRAVVAAPVDLSRWSEALNFANCLSQPARGGKRHNLTNQLTTQIDRAVKGLSSTQADPPSQDSSAHHQRGRRGGTRAGDEDDAAVSRASAKLQEGDIRGAVRCLCSDETLAPLTKAVRQALVAKHPPCPQDRRSPPSTTSPPMTATPAEVKEAIRSFAPGSAGGNDGLRPQHLKDISGDRV